ncbi:MAG TPA: hypothetical protein ACHBX0_14520 [Arsenophonus sp.]
MAIFLIGVFAHFLAKGYTWLFMKAEFSFEYVKKACKQALVLGPMVGAITYIAYYNSLFNKKDSKK